MIISPYYLSSARPKSAAPQRLAHPVAHLALAATIAAPVVGASVAPGAQAQVQAQEDSRRGRSAALMEEVIVSARKREEGAQDVPLSISAFGAEQIDALKVRDLTNLSVGLPNVALDDAGTTRGVANFSIRGLAVNTSVPSIDPTVGVFVNGVYLGVNNGIIFDVFDLESIEVLRGPQGILFGRNVTGGAILMNTKKPGDELSGSARVAVDGGGDGGLNYYAMGTLGGPVSDTLGLKLSAYYNEDQGYFRRQAYPANGVSATDVGAVQQTMIRPTLVWAPTEHSEFVARYEYSDISGDGAVAQSHRNGRGEAGQLANFDRESFGNSNDFIGFQTNETHFLTLEFNQDVDLGEGTVTAIYGWRDTYAFIGSDIDAQPVWAFHSKSWLDARQNSFELRFNGQFGAANVTTGLYWFDNDLGYHERRDFAGALTGNLAPAVIQDGGGLYGVETRALFAALDYELTERLVLTLGLRYTDEEKYAEIASLAGNTSSGYDPRSRTAPLARYANDKRCNIVDRGEGLPRCPFDFTGNNDWQTWSPKVGLSYALSDRAQVYTHWTRGFRSGGYNLRNSTPRFPPQAFDEEQVDNFELGYKSQQSWGPLNAALFYTSIDGLQLDLSFSSQNAGVVQIIRNSANATIWGIELDSKVALSERLLLIASLGYLNASYNKVLFDMNQDGRVDGKDKSLKLPRAPELTYSIGLNYDRPIGSWGYASARISYAYRDKVFYEDNLGVINEQDILDAGVDFYSDSGRWVFSLYGRNLLDTVKNGGDAQLPPAILGVPTGGTFSPLMRGQTYGAEVTYNF